MRCEAEVPYKLSFYRTRQCSKNAIVEENGKWFCSLHCSNAIQKRKERKEQREKEQQPLKLAMYIASLKRKSK
jgi:hypothetical protein